MVRLIRVYVDALLAPGARVTLEGAAAAHVRRVLRLEPGDDVTLFNGDGFDYPAKIAAFDRNAVEAAVASRTAARAESTLAVTISRAGLRPGPDRRRRY